MKYDLAIVGGGPAGLMAARTAGRAGLKVLLVEKNARLGHARRLCSRLLRLGGGGFQSDVVVTDAASRKVTVSIELDGDESLLHFRPLPPDATVRYTGAWGACFNDAWFSPSGHVFRHQPDSHHFTGLIVDKDHLLAGMAEEATAVGCELRADTQCVEMADGPDGVRLELKTGDRTDTVHAAKAILADGSFSKLAEQLGYNEERHVVGVRVKFLTLILDRVDAPLLDTQRLKFCIPSLHRGYITLSKWPPGQFQLGATTTTGSQVNLPSVLEQFMRDSRYAEWFRHAQIVDRTGCNMDLRPAVWAPARGNSICAGDNVAYGETSIKHAIGCGYVAANALKASLEGQDGSAIYNDFWQNSLNYFSKQYREQLSKTRPIPASLDDKEADALFRWLEEHHAAGMPHDVLPAHREALFADLPVIAEKLLGPRDGQKRHRVA